MDRSDQIARAIAIVSAQVGVTDDQALTLMIARARFSEMDVEAVATAVNDGRIRFDDSP